MDWTETIDQNGTARQGDGRERTKNGNLIRMMDVKKRLQKGVHATHEGGGVRERCKELF